MAEVPPTRIQAPTPIPAPAPAPAPAVSEAAAPERPATLLPAAELARTLTPHTSPNGIRYAASGDIRVAREDLERLLQAVPAVLAPALAGHVFYFVPLALPEVRRGESADPDSHTGHTLISTVDDPELADEAICHRNVSLPATPAAAAHEAVFFSARLLRDQFSLAFEFFINIGHAFAAAVGVPADFEELAWAQARAGVRGESSQDAWENRHQALGLTASQPSGHSPDQPSGAPAAEPASQPPPPAAGVVDERAKTSFLLSALADALAIYQLSLTVDFDYAELREREYPLLAPAALADRLRLMAKLFPPNRGYDFSIRYRRR